MDKFFQVYIVALIVVVSMAIYVAIGNQQTFISDCCATNYRTIESDSGDRHWCLDCKKWCELVKEARWIFFGFA